MSLFKQVLLVLVFVFIMLFMIITAFSLDILKNSTKESIYQNIQNSVTNLSMSITNAGEDESSIKTAINAAFDNGSYAKIVFKNTDEEVIYELSKDVEIDEDIPTWFVDLVDIGDITALASVSKSWNVLGIIEIYGDKSIYFEQIYRVFQKLIQSLLIGFAIFFVILFVLFKYILRPLKIVRNQADAVMENRFIISKDIPFTQEFKSVTLSINSMVSKFEAMFKQTNNLLKTNKELMYIDEVTKLYNRKYFLLKADEYLNENSLNSRGFAIILSLKLDILNQNLGYEKTNKVLVELSEILKKDFSNSLDLFVRLNGSEFVIILPNCELNEAQKCLDKLILDTKNLEELKSNIYIGLTKYENENSVKTLFTKLDYVISQAKLDPSKEYFYQENIENYKTKDEWINIINSSLLEDKFKLFYRDINDLKTNSLLFKTLNFKIDGSNNNFSYIDFIAAVVKLNRLSEVYLHIISKLFKENMDEKISIELPSKFIEDLNNYTKLKEILTLNQNKNIIFEIEEISFYRNLENTNMFIELFKKYGFDFAIYNFIASSDDYKYIKEQRPVYIKSSKNFLIESKQSLNILKILTQSLGIKLIATSVENEDMPMLQELEIDAISNMLKN
ncbi:LapD/MoxY N-terminal periplasmic domain-containing protein [Arcobacter vandammei]|uniref:bifunctional diguanylate cyclase/phosphodiesterase n=1 Tax=Arcobacter vandammei TaxID=2782243 RepID=UPI0018E02BE3|nr:LapD/MoxY N-terminal periplasmic domain-containing protein [Arcobacter vandammei]